VRGRGPPALVGALFAVGICSAFSVILLSVHDLRQASGNLNAVRQRWNDSRSTRTVPSPPASWCSCRVR
jgi:hypothetical protein